MKGNLNAWFAVFTGLCLATCKPQSRTTYLAGKVTNEKKQAVANLPIVIAGHRKGMPAQYDAIQTIYTNNLGEYAIELEAGNQFSDLDVTVDLLKFADLGSPYSGYRVSLNDKSTAQCCPAQIGYTSKYDFVLLAEDR